MGSGGGERRSAGALPALVLLLLGLVALRGWVELAREHAGVDFYQYWAVGAVSRLTGGMVRNPYRQPRAFAVVLEENARRSEDPRLEAAASFRRRPDLIQTPLLFAAFASCGPDYGRSLHRFRLAQAAAWVLGWVAVGALLPWSGRWVAAAALAFTLGYEPLRSDIRVGNLNTLEFGVLAACLVLEARLSDATRRRRVIGSLLLYLLGALVLFKPNHGLVALAVAAAAARRLGIRSAAAGLAVAAPALLATAAIPAVAFGTGAIWSDWWAVATRPGFLGLFPMEAGNFSLAVLVAHWTGGEVLAASAGIGAALVSCLAAVALVARRRSRSWMPGLDALLPLAVAATLAAAPVAWLHYWLLVPLPALLLARGGRGRAVAGIAAVAAGSAQLDPLLRLAGAGAAVPWLMASSSAFLCGGGIAAWLAEARPPTQGPSLPADPGDVRFARPERTA
jgi:hypothetical protein